MRHLTLREEQVLDALVKHGLDKLIADELDISYRTVEQTLNRIALVVGFRNRVKLAVWWVQHKRAQ